MHISKKTDVAFTPAPSFEKGTNPFDNEGIKPRSSIPDTPGEKASNETVGRSISKAQPFGKGGTGFTNKD